MMRMRIVLTGLMTAAVLAGCSSGKSCLPEGQKATVLRTGREGDLSYVTMKMESGAERTCTGKSVGLVMQPGDVIDGATLTYGG